MKIYTLSFLALAVLTVLPNVASAQAPAGKPSVEMHSVKIEVKFVEALPDKGGAFPHGSTAELLAALTKDGAKMTQIALQATMLQDVPVNTSQTDSIPFVTTVNGKPQTNYTPVTNSFSASPHFNADGTLRLSLALQHSEAQKSDTPLTGPPNVVSQSTSILRTFTSGQPLILGGFVSGTENLVFITATLLPDTAKKQ